MADNGPMWGDAAAEALGLTAQQWWAAMGGDTGRCPWFTLDAPGPAGWTLTERGRAEALGEPVPSDAATAPRA